MAGPNPDMWAPLHMRWLALERWDDEGGASPNRPTAGSSRAAAGGERWQWLELFGPTGPARLRLEIDVSASPTIQAGE